MKRDTFQPRTIRLVGELQLATLKSLLAHLPLDPVKPLEVTIREEMKPRKPSANALMWVGPLADIAEQAYYNGRQFSAEIWHETYKRLYLPESYDSELCREGYQKWAFDPTGTRILMGSTTQLTAKGFSQYLEQVMADGASMGVMFSAGVMA